MDAYLAQLGHDPQHQLLQQQHTGVMPDLDGLSGGCDSGAAAGGHGSLVAAMRTRSLTTFDDDLDEDSPAGPEFGVLLRTRMTRDHDASQVSFRWPALMWIPQKTYMLNPPL